VARRIAKIIPTSLDDAKLRKFINFSYKEAFYLFILGASVLYMVEIIATNEGREDVGIN